METTLHMQPDTYEKQKGFDSAIEKLRGKITELQKTIHSQQELGQLNAIPLLVNQIESIFYHLMDQHKKLDSKFQELNSRFYELNSEFQELAFNDKRYALWKQFITDAILFMLIQLDDQSLREALERLHDHITHRSIHDPLPDKYQMMIGF